MNYYQISKDEYLEIWNIYNSYLKNDFDTFEDYLNSEKKYQEDYDGIKEILFFYKNDNNQIVPWNIEAHGLCEIMCKSQQNDLEIHKMKLKKLSESLNSMKEYEIEMLVFDYYENKKLEK